MNFFTKELIINFYLYIMSTSCKGGNKNLSINTKKLQSCKNITKISANSGVAYYHINSPTWSNCTFQLDTTMKGNGAVMVTRIFAVELLNLKWSEVIMPAGDRVPYNTTTPRYREGEIPWCGIYFKKKNNRKEAANEGLCPGLIQESLHWPPIISVNAKHLTISIWFSFLDSRKGRPNTPVTSSPVNQTTLVTQPTQTCLSDAKSITFQERSNSRDGSSTNGLCNRNLLIVISVIGSLTIILLVILIITCLKFKKTTPEIPAEVIQDVTPTFRRYDRVSTLPKPTKNSQNNPDDSASNYHYIDLPAFSNTPSHLQVSSDQQPKSFSESISFSASDTGTVSKELVTNQLYHL